MMMMMCESINRHCKSSWQLSCVRDDGDEGPYMCSSSSAAVVPLRLLDGRLYVTLSLQQGKSRVELFVLCVYVSRLVRVERFGHKQGWWKSQTGAD